MESDSVVVANESVLPQGTKRLSTKGSIFGDFPDYKMSYSRRGLAYIFNHDKFHQKTWPNNQTPTPRLGSGKDRDDLTQTLENLDFEVKCFNNRTAAQVRQEIANLAEVNHEDHDCLLVVVTSHGQEGEICAFDAMYDIEELWTPFTSCPTLAGKPKLFFIQACHGFLRDGGTLVTKTDGPAEYYSIPTQADFLFVYSTIPGYESYRNEENGAVFLQALCKVLSERGRQDDLLSMVTVVLRTVAASEIQIEDKVMKTILDLTQMPCFTSQLIHRVYFHQKPPVTKTAKRCSIV